MKCKDKTKNLAITKEYQEEENRNYIRRIM